MKSLGTWHVDFFLAPTMDLLDQLGPLVNTKRQKTIRITNENEYHEESTAANWSKNLRGDFASIKKIQPPEWKPEPPSCVLHLNDNFRCNAS